MNELALPVRLVLVDAAVGVAPAGAGGGVAFATVIVDIVDEKDAAAVVGEGCGEMAAAAAGRRLWCLGRWDAEWWETNAYFSATCGLT